MMTRDDILDQLKRRQSELHARGVVRAALFGSLARDEQRDDSDIDILVELDPKVVVTILDYVGVKDFIEGMFESPVDVVSTEGLKPVLRPRATRDAVYAF